MDQRLQRSGPGRRRNRRHRCPEQTVQRPSEEDRHGRAFPFEAHSEGEALLYLQARARTDPALLAIQVDGSLISHAVVPSGGSIPVAVSLGHVARGPHRVTVEPVAGFSAAAIDPDPVFTLTDVDDPASVVLRHAPILFGRTPEVIHDGLNGLLVPAGDPDPMAQAIDSVLLRPELAARLAAAGGRDSERYDADAQVERVLEAYREALAGRPRRQPSEGVPPEFTASLGPGHVASVRSGS